jgi:hypothetical protein
VCLASFWWVNHLSHPLMLGDNVSLLWGGHWTLLRFEFHPMVVHRGPISPRCKSDPSVYFLNSCVWQWQFLGVYPTQIEFLNGCKWFISLCFPMTMAILRYGMPHPNRFFKCLDCCLAHLGSASEPGVGLLSRVWVLKRPWRIGNGRRWKLGRTEPGSLDPW